QQHAQGGPPADSPHGHGLTLFPGTRVRAGSARGGGRPSAPVRGEPWFRPSFSLRRFPRAGTAGAGRKRFAVARAAAYAAQAAAFDDDPRPAAGAGRAALAEEYATR